MVEIGNIHNYYGSLKVQEKDGRYYWSIENYDGDHFSEIPKYLYDTLIKYQGEFEKGKW